MLISHNDSPAWGVKVYSEWTTPLGTLWEEELFIVSSKEEAEREAATLQSPAECLENYTATVVVRLTPKPILKNKLAYAHREF